MSHFQINLFTTHLESNRGLVRLDTPGPARQFQCTWYRDGRVVRRLPAIMTKHRDHLRFRLPVRELEGNDPVLTLAFSPAPGEVSSPLDVEVKNARPERWRGAFYWPSHRGGYPMAHAGVEFEMMVSVFENVTETQYFLDPEMNVEPPPDPDPERPGKKRRQ